MKRMPGPPCFCPPAHLQPQIWLEEADMEHLPIYTSNKHKWSILEKTRVVGYAAKADTMIENSKEMQDD